LGLRFRLKACWFLFHHQGDRHDGFVWEIMPKGGSHCRAQDRAMQQQGQACRRQRAKAAFAA